MVETYRRKIQTKDPPLQTYVQAVKSVGDWIIEGYKAKIVPPSAGADALIVRDYGDTENRIRLFEDGSIEVRIARITSSFAYWGAYLSLVRSPEAFFRGRTEATHIIHFQTYDGAVWQSAARLVGGYLEIARGKLTGDLIPDIDATRVLGSPTLRYANLYAVTTTIGDLVLKGKNAKWRIFEREDGLYVKNERTGKLYKIKLEECVER